MSHSRFTGDLCRNVCVFSVRCLLAASVITRYVLSECISLQSHAHNLNKSVAFDVIHVETFIERNGPFFSVLHLSHYLFLSLSLSVSLSLVSSSNCANIYEREKKIVVVVPNKHFL